MDNPDAARTINTNLTRRIAAKSNPNGTVAQLKKKIKNDLNPASGERGKKRGSKNRLKRSQRKKKLKT